MVSNLQRRISNKMTIQEWIEKSIREVQLEGFGTVEIIIRNGQIYRIKVTKEVNVD